MLTGDNCGGDCDGCDDNISDDDDDDDDDDDCQVLMTKRMFYRR